MPTVTGLATSYIQFSRASNATVTDSSGFIEWAGHNLLTNSETFDASAWTKSSATVTANTDPAPNGTTTGDTIAASGANGTTLQTWTAEAVPYTFGVWLRRKTGTGTIEIAADSGTYTTVTITSSWALYTVTQTPAAGSKSAGIRIVTSADEVYAWGAHLYRSGLGGMVLNPARGDAYYPTTPPNLLGYTEDFSNAAWTKSSCSIVANSIVAPNGLQAADKLVEDTSASAKTIFQAVTTQASPCVFSCYAKAGERTFVVLYNLTAAVAQCFNLSTGSLGASTGSPTSSITDAGNGWYRCSIAHTATAASNSFRIYLAASNTVSVAYTGDGTSGIYIWGAQLSNSASLDTYSPVYGAAVTSAAYYAPRLDYDPSTLAAKGLLVEEQRTNLLLRSAEFDVTATWTGTPAGTALTPVRTANAGVGPDGASTADRLQLTLNGGTTTSDIIRIRQSLTPPSAGTYIFSVWLKSYDGVSAYTMALQCGPTVQPITVTGAWQRFSVTATLAVASNANDIFIRGGQTPTHSDSVDILAWGAQTEAGSFSTSYIPTTTASATRSADVASVSTQAFPYGATEGSLVASFTPVNVAAARRAAQLDDATENERITLGTNSTPNGLMTVIDGGSPQASIATGTPAANTTIKLASRYKLDDFAVSANGAAVGTDTSGTLPTVTTLRLGSGTSSTEPLNGWLRQITYIPRVLTNAELVARST